MAPALSIIEQIRNAYSSAVVRECQETKKQKVKKGNLAPVLILKGEHLAGDGRQACDCIFIYETEDKVYILLVELKSRSLGNTIQQLKSCNQMRKFFLQGIKIQGKSIEVRFAWYSEGKNSMDMRRIKKARIEDKVIQPKNFSEPIASIL